MGLSPVHARWDETVATNTQATMLSVLHQRSYAVVTGLRLQA